MKTNDGYMIVCVHKESSGECRTRCTFHVYSGRKKKVQTADFYQQDAASTSEIHALWMDSVTSAITSIIAFNYFIRVAKKDNGRFFVKYSRTIRSIATMLQEHYDRSRWIITEFGNDTLDYKFTTIKKYEKYVLEYMKSSPTLDRMEI